MDPNHRKRMEQVADLPFTQEKAPAMQLKESFPLPFEDENHIYLLGFDGSEM